MEITGEIVDIRYRNEVNSYTIADFETDEELTTIVGYLPFINEGDTLKLIGKFVEHKEYGRQFKIDTFEKLMPQTIAGLEKYLANGNIKGIGERIAKRIIEKFGEETIHIFQHEPSRLAEIRGISKEGAQEMAASFVENWGVWQIVGFLERFGIGAEYAKKVYDLLGTNAIEQIEADPYILIDIAKGVDFKQIDKMALDLGINYDNEKRISSGIKYGLIRSTYNGNSCVVKENLIEFVVNLLNVNVENINESLINLNAKKEIVIEKIENIDKKYEDISSNLKNIYYELQEISRDISDYREDVYFDEQERNEVEERLDLIYNLKRKYGNDVQEILNYKDEIEAEINHIENLDEYNNKLKKELKQLKLAMTTLAEKMHELRNEYGKVLSININKVLEDLEMKNANINIHVDYNEEEFFENGKDVVEFYITTNLGEDEKQLSKIASGGEMSRIMLAIKKVLADTDKMPVLIFDEIDTGISGKAAGAVAEKLNGISKNHQVLCISHLPSIAAIADYNYFISKRVINERTNTNIRLLNEKETLEEIARISSGEINEATIQYAMQLRNKKVS